MRDSLTVLAVLVIGVLTTALVGPYLIDWNSHRELIEQRLTAAAGTEVTVAGPIDLKLLPRPLFKFSRVTIGAPGPGRPHVTIEEIDAEVSLTALMRGELQVVDTTLKRPRLTLVEAAGGGFGLPLPGADDADRVTLDHMGIVDGSVALDFADGRHLALSGLETEAEATSLRGPFKAAGRFGPADAPVPFHLSTGTFDGHRMILKVRLDGAAPQPIVDIDGTLSSGPPPTPPKAKPGTSFTGPGFDGTLTVTGRLPLAQTPADIPWHVTAHLTADRDHGSASDLEIRAGTDLRAMIATGDAAAVFGPTTSGDAGRGAPMGSIQLHGAQLNLDALAVVPEGSGTPPPRGADLLGRMLGAVGNGAATVGLPVRLTTTVRFDTVTFGGQSVLGTELRASAGPEPTIGLHLASQGPDNARLALDGSFEPGDAGVFRGHVEASSGDLSRTATFLTPVAPDLAAWLKGTVPARNVAGVRRCRGVAGRHHGAERDPAARRLEARRHHVLYGRRRDRTRPAPRRPRLGRPRSRHPPGPVGRRNGVARHRPVAGAVGHGREGRSRRPARDAGQLALHLTKSGDDLHLDRLALAVGGSAIEATADRTGQDARAEARIRAPQLAPLAQVLWRLFPASATAALRDRAAVLSPFDGRLEAEASASAVDSALAPRRFALDGTAAGTHVTATLTPDRRDDGLDAATRPVTVAVHADATRATALLEQLGLSSPGIAEPPVTSPDRGASGTAGPATSGAPCSTARPGAPSRRVSTPRWQGTSRRHDAVLHGPGAGRTRPGTRRGQHPPISGPHWSISASCRSGRPRRRTTPQQERPVAVQRPCIRRVAGRPRLERAGVRIASPARPLRRNRGRGRPQPRSHAAEARPARRTSGPVRADGARAPVRRYPAGSRLGITGAVSAARRSTAAPGPRPRSEHRPQPCPAAKSA